MILHQILGKYLITICDAHNQIPIFRTEYNKPRQTFKNLSGLSLCFLRIKFCLPVGETCGLPRANTVRPYRALGKHFIISPLSVHYIGLVVFCVFGMGDAGKLIEELFD